MNHGPYFRDLTKIPFKKPLTLGRNVNSLTGFCLQSDIIVPPLYSAAAIGIPWVSSLGCIRSFSARGPSGLRMKTYDCPQNSCCVEIGGDLAKTVTRGSLFSTHIRSDAVAE